jgi:hypothetical protein
VIIYTKQLLQVLDLCKIIISQKPDTQFFIGKDHIDFFSKLLNEIYEQNKTNIEATIEDHDAAQEK